VKAAIWGLFKGEFLTKHTKTGQFFVFEGRRNAEQMRRNLFAEEEVDIVKILKVDVYTRCNRKKKLSGRKKK